MAAEPPDAPVAGGSGRNYGQTRISLNLTDAALADALTGFERQTGNRVIDARAESGDNPPPKRVSLKIDDEPFWSALDELLDAAQMSPYPYADGDGLKIVDRPPGTLRRSGRATYADVFRIEATSVEARRGLRSPNESGVELELEIAWEPRLRPVALIQAAADLSAETDDGVAVPTAADDEAFRVEPPANASSVQVTVALQLPGRGSQRLAKLRGRMIAFIPQQKLDFKFKGLATARNAVQRSGGVAVTLRRVAQNEGLWEIHARVAVDTLPNDDVKDPPRGWVFENVAYLEDAAGGRVDHAGFETTMQDQRETGFAYFFELPEGRKIDEYAWVYRTPAAIQTVPVEFELDDILLP